MNETFIIAGAGQAGGQAAESLRAEGFEGRVILIGEEPYVPYERPPLSKQFLAGEIEAERTFIRKQTFFEDKDIELKFDVVVTAIDRAAKNLSLDNGETLHYDKLLIATGSRVRKLPLPGAELAGIHYLRTIDDVIGIKKDLKSGARMVIVGGGYIGLEGAAVAREAGCAVTVLEMLPRILNRVVAPEISDYYHRFHTAKGVDIRTGIAVTAFEGKGHVTRVKCDDGSSFDADFVVIGVGIVPNVELAAEIGLEVDNGIVVDDCTRTNDPDIFAAGDVTSHPNRRLGRRIRLESVPNAVAQGQTAAKAMMGKFEPYNDVPWFWSDQYDLKLQMAGISEPDDTVVIRGDMAANQFSAFYLRAGKVVAVNAINSVRDFTAARRMIEAGLTVDPATLTDTSVVLRSLL